MKIPRNRGSGLREAGALLSEEGRPWRRRVEGPGTLQTGKATLVAVGRPIRPAGRRATLFLVQTRI